MQLVENNLINEILGNLTDKELCNYYNDIVPNDKMRVWCGDIVDENRDGVNRWYLVKIIRQEIQKELTR